eukprot:g7108.t1
MKTQTVEKNERRTLIVPPTLRYLTVFGILSFIALFLSLVQLSTKNHVSYFRLPAQTIRTRNVTNLTCIDCEDDVKVLFAELGEHPELDIQRAKCLEGIRSRMIEDYEPFFENVKSIALIDVALHFNLGDSILWRAAVHLATLFGHNIAYLCSESQRGGAFLKRFPHCNTTEIIHAVGNHGLVMYQGGGNWGNLYRPIQGYRMKVLRELGDAYSAEIAPFKVIQLPQSIVYIHNDQTLIDQDDSIINSLPDGMFTLFTRQNESFEWAKEHYKSNIGIKVSPDIAFALGPLTPFKKPIIDVILLMRGDHEDKEKDTDLKHEVAKRFNGTGVTYSFQGYNYTNLSTEYIFEHPAVLSEVRLNSVIRTISKGRILITNRFHGHVIGMMMGKLTLWIDTNQQKLKRSRAIAFSSSVHCTDKSMRSFEFSSTLDAIDAAIKHILLVQKRASKTGSRKI